jgi:hypothetical protein
MRTKALALVGALGWALSVAPANASPMVPAPAVPQASNIEQVADGCGRGFHRNRRGYCVRSYRPHAYHRHYNRSQPHYGYYRGYPYYGGGYERWNRPSPSDHMANRLNAQQARRGWGYWGY